MLEGKIEIKGDIIEPIDVEWDAETALSPEALAFIEKGIERSSKKETLYKESFAKYTKETPKMGYNELFSYEGGNIKVIIERIVPSSRFYKSFKPYKLIPIQNDAYFYFGTKIAHDPLFLPKLYAALTWLTGEGDDYYDDYKGSFSFRFVLSVKKNGNLSKYAYQIFHYRSYIQVDLYEMVDEDDPRNVRHYVQPNDKYFSGKDINTFSHMFCLNAIELMEGAKHIPQPFFKCSDSNLLLFGYDDKEGYFFEDFISEKDEEDAKDAKEYMNDADEYEKAKKLLEEKWKKKS